jgi:hypothetical protein
MDRELAMAAGRDAANERMRSAGRTAWSRADYNAAVRTFNRLYPIERELYDAGELAYWRIVENGLTARMGRVA